MKQNVIKIEYSEILKNLTKCKKSCWEMQKTLKIQKTFYVIKNL